MIRIFTAFAFAIALATATATPSALAAHSDQHAVEETQSVVIHLSHFTNDLHAAFMALNIGTMLLESGQADVTLFLDLEGVRLADARSRSDLAWGDSGGIGETYDGFVAAGGAVMVCPHCAEQASVDADNLREGAQMATREGIAAMFLSADKVIDY
jgi:sulfur relay (sulfurtransferase) complex TusBCD TusD component (DsrE family)